MKSTITITLHDGRVATTTGTTPHDLTAIADFIASWAVEPAHVEWTISAASGPDYSARYGDIASVDVRVEA